MKSLVSTYVFQKPAQTIRRSPLVPILVLVFPVGALLFTGDVVLGLSSLFLLMLAASYVDRKFSDEEETPDEVYSGRERYSAVEFAKMLDLLKSDDVAVYHDQTCPHGNCNHIIITRQGAIILLEVVASSGIITSSGWRLLRNYRPFGDDPIERTWRKVNWLRNHLWWRIGEEVRVTAAICCVQASVEIASQLVDLPVIMPDELDRIIANAALNQYENGDLWLERDRIFSEKPPR